MGRFRSWRPGQDYLLEGEVSIASTRLHWVLVWKPAVLMVGILLASVWLGGAGDSRAALAIGLVILGFAGYFGYRLLEWYHTYFEVTDKRLLMRSGLLTTRIDMMPVSKVTDMSYEKPLLGRVLGFGTFILESAGQDQALSRISHLPDSDRLYRETLSVIFGKPSEEQVERFEQEQEEHEQEQQREWEEYGQYWDDPDTLQQEMERVQAEDHKQGSARYGQRQSMPTVQAQEQWWDAPVDSPQDQQTGHSGSTSRPIYGRKPHE